MGTKTIKRLNPKIAIEYLLLRIELSNYPLISMLPGALSSLSYPIDGNIGTNLLGRHCIRDRTHEMLIPYYMHSGPWMIRPTEGLPWPKPSSLPMRSFRHFRTLPKVDRPNQKVRKQNFYQSKTILKLIIHKHKHFLQNATSSRNPS